MKTPKDNWRISPTRTALLVIDMQKAWIQEGAPREIPDARRVLPGINQLADFCRRRKIPVIFIREAFRPDLTDMGLMKDILPALADPEWGPLEGNKGAEFHSDLDVRNEDYVITKIRYSPFISGSSSLEPLLRGLGCDTVIICGCGMEACAAATAADGMQIGFKVFFVSDLTARISGEKSHYEAILNIINRQYARVITFEEIRMELDI